MLLFDKNGNECKVGIDKKIYLKKGGFARFCKDLASLNLNNEDAYEKLTGKKPVKTDKDDVRRSVKNMGSD